MKKKICIVGMGPAGLGAAITFAKSTCAPEVLCVDAGPLPGERCCYVLNNQTCKKEKFCQMISGFGGCSLLSGGKVSAYPAGDNLSSILGSEELAKDALTKALILFGQNFHIEKPNVTAENVEETKKAFGKLGFEFRYYDSYLYHQTDFLRDHEKILLQLKNSGISMLMNSQLTGIKRKEKDYELFVVKGKKKFTIHAEYVILAMGRLGRNLTRKLNSELDLHGEENFLDVGVRLEFPTDILPDIWKYHNDLKLAFGNARTFCVCKEGKVVQYFVDDLCFTEGFCSNDQKTALTNLGIILRCEQTKEGLSLFDEIKNRTLRTFTGKIARQNLLDYLNSDNEHGSSSPIKNSQSLWLDGNVNACFPEALSVEIRKAVFFFIKQLFPKESWNKISVFAPEVDYGGLRFSANPDFSIVSKLYLVGDGTGRFRGILQSFCSGMISAESIVGGECEKRT